MLAVLHALAYAEAGKRVGVRDSDAQSSMRSNSLNAGHQSAFTGKNIVWAPAGSDDSFDVVIADGPPNTSDPVFLDEFDHCDVFVLVTGTSVGELGPTAEAYNELIRRRPDVPVRLLINRYDKRRKLDRDILQLLDNAGLATVPRIEQFVPLSESFRHIEYGGWETAAAMSRDSKAIEALQTQIASVALEVYQVAAEHRSSEISRTAPITVTA